MEVVTLIANFWAMLYPDTHKLASQAQGNPWMAAAWGGGVHCTSRLPPKLGSNVDGRLITSMRNKATTVGPMADAIRPCANTHSVLRDLGNLVGLAKGASNEEARA